MSKNMTRKGLALGAGLSLAFTGLVAPAAYAVDPVQLKETVGTGYNVLTDGNFELTALITNAAKSGGSESVKFRVVDSGSKLTAAGIDLGDGSAGAANGALEAGDDTLATFTDGVAVVDSAGATAGTAYKLMLDPSAATDAFSVTVQAWVDFDGDNTIDTGEFSSPVRTVTFYPADEVTFTVNLVTPVLGANNINSTVTTSPALNVAALASALDVGYATYVASTDAYTIVSGGGTVTAGGAFSDGVAVTADDDYKLAIGGGGLAAATYVAQAVLGTTEVGNAVFYTVGASDATAISAVSVVDTNDVTGEDIRTNAGASFKVTVTDTNSDPVAGVSVVFSFTEGHSDTDAVINVGTHSIKNGDTATAAKTVTATTDAKGVATVSATFSGFAAGDNFMSVTAKVAAVAATAALQPDFVDTAYGAIYSHNTLGTSAALKVTSGSTYPLTYSVTDNFGQLLADANYRVVLSDGGSVLKTATLGSGIASFSVTDQTTVAETWTATVQKYNSATANWGSDLSSGGVAITPVVGASNAAAAVSLAGSSTTGLTLNLSELKNSDTRLGETAATTASGTVATLSGNVTDAAGAATYSTVTLSAPGVMFASGSVTSVGSITVQTSASGAFGGVTAHSNTAGDVTVTATAGSASKTLKLTFAAAADDTEATVTLSVTGNEPGKTMVVTGNVADKYGNPVAVQAADFSLSYDGPGFVVGSLPTSVDATGKFEFKVLLGARDVISGTVTVETAGADGADLASDTTAQQADNVVAALSLAPVVAPVADTKVNAGSFKGYVAVYAKGYEGKRLSAKIGNDWVIVNSLASNFERVTDFTGAGVSISVRIYIDRVLIDTINLVTK